MSGRPRRRTSVAGGGHVLPRNRVPGYHHSGAGWLAGMLQAEDDAEFTSDCADNWTPGPQNGSICQFCRCRRTDEKAVLQGRRAAGTLQTDGAPLVAGDRVGDICVFSSVRFPLKRHPSPPCHLPDTIPGSRQSGPSTFGLGNAARTLF